MARTLYPWEVPAPSPVVEAPAPKVAAPAPAKPKAAKVAKVVAPVVENPADDDGELDSDMS